MHLLRLDVRLNFLVDEIPQKFGSRKLVKLEKLPVFVTRFTDFVLLSKKVRNGGHFVHLRRLIGAYKCS